MTRSSPVIVAGALALAALALATSACVGTLEPVDGTGGTGDDDSTASAARQMFDSEVTPLLGTCSGCHTGAVGSSPTKFLGSGPQTGWYAALVADTGVNGNFDPANATLLTKGAHSGVQAWTTTQADTISSWLLAEAQER